MVYQKRECQRLQTFLEIKPSLESSTQDNPQYTSRPTNPRPNCTTTTRRSTNAFSCGSTRSRKPALPVATKENVSATTSTCESFLSSSARCNSTADLLRGSRHLVCWDGVTADSFSLRFLRKRKQVAGRRAFECVSLLSACVEMGCIVSVLCQLCVAR